MEDKRKHYEENKIKWKTKESIMKKTRLSGKKKEAIIKETRLSGKKRRNYEGSIIKWE